MCENRNLVRKLGVAKFQQLTVKPECVMFMSFCFYNLISVNLDTFYNAQGCVRLAITLCKLHRYTV